ncbi:TlpA disulfide reductase family protein [Prevotella amnii]|uniref:peroxiredoxin family protein n=1 Tax=Prevotella amnii TaxID=419005 RepID=UPI00336A6BFC
MKKFLIMATLAVCTFALHAQDTKPYEEKMNSIEAQYKVLLNEYQAIKKRSKTSITTEDANKIEEIKAKAERLDSLQKATTLEIVRKFKNTTFPAKYVSDLVYSFDFDEMKEVCDPSSGYYNDKSMELVKKRWESLQLRQPGIKFHELKMADLNGKAVTLSDYAGKGKYVLVDFWASWCGPCRMEMPNVVKAYQQFHPKGFEIVGVSFDQKKESWAAAIKSLGMTWPQMSDLKGWQCAAAKTYGIMTIPSNILIDPQGKIVKIDLMGEELQKVLSEIYK